MHFLVIHGHFKTRQLQTLEPVDLNESLNRGTLHNLYIVPKANLEDA